MNKVLVPNRIKKDKAREHNHFPDGKTGYIPQGVGQINLKLLKK